MSSIEKPTPTTKKYLIDRVVKWSVIMSLRTLFAFLIAIPMVIFYPVLGVAEPSEGVKMEQAAQADMERIVTEAGGDMSMMDRLKGMAAEVKQSATDLKDGIFNKGEREKRLQDEVNLWRAEYSKVKQQLAEQNVSRGIRHDLMLTCTKDLTSYLQSIPK